MKAIIYPFKCIEIMMPAMIMAYPIISAGTMLKANLQMNIPTKNTEINEAFKSKVENLRSWDKYLIRIYLTPRLKISGKTNKVIISNVYVS